MKYNQLEFLSNKGKSFLLLLFPSVMNLLYMHYYIFFNEYMEVPMFVFSPIFNFLSVILDVTILYTLFYFLSFRRIRLSLASVFLVTLVWSFSNTFYARFFSHYISLSAIGQAGNLFEGLIVDSIISGFKWIDLFYLLSIFFFVFLYSKIKDVFPPKTLSFSVSTIAFILLLTFVIYSLYHVTNSSTRKNKELYVERIKGFLYGGGGGTAALPNLFRYQIGCTRYLCSEEYAILFPRILNNQERKEIKMAYTDYKLKVSHYSDNDSIQNVVFIILESFLSVSSDLKVDGKEITPFLNSLKRSPSVYYNGHVNPNITIGESGDGQFIYMTGILPCRSKLVLAEAKNKIFPALPIVLEKEKAISYSEIIIPTTPKVWNQEDMNHVYGIDKMYSFFDLYGSEHNSIYLSLNDEQIFDMAIHSDKENNRPFFSVILSTSTHMPYTEYVDKDFILDDDVLPFEYRVYLNACHYVDTQIHKYIQHLKDKNLFDNTLIFIMADHHAHIGSLGMEGKISKELPLYIINGGFDVSKAYKGPCNQLDVYTTLLDILNIDCEWKGLGNTLLLPNYVNSVTPEVYELSEMMVEGDFFREQ